MLTTSTTRINRRIKVPASIPPRPSRATFGYHLRSTLLPCRQ